MFTQAAQQFAEGVKQIDGLEVVGKPDMCLVAIKSTSKKLNIYKVNDLMSQRGWHLNALQFPSSVHMCFTAQHTEVVPELLKVATLSLPSNASHVYAHVLCTYFAHGQACSTSLLTTCCVCLPVSCLCVVPSCRRYMPCAHDAAMKVLWLLPAGPERLCAGSEGGP